jgi:hypothetical protein
MKTRFALIGSLAVLASTCVLNAGTLFTEPIIFVQPAKLDFGTVFPRDFVTNSFLVENVGGGTLVGKATVPPPFKIISGDTYQLKRSEVQVVTVVYTPDLSGTNIEKVKFTGADGLTTAPVIGKLDTRPLRYKKKHK